MGKTHKKQIRRQQRGASQLAPPTNTGAADQLPVPAERANSETRRLFRWVGSANKAVLGAIGAGLIAIITGCVTNLPHVVSRALSGTPKPLTAAGHTSQQDFGGADPCELQGSFIVPGTPHVAENIRTAQLAALVSGTADAESTSGTYTLQAAPDQTVVITAIHTVLVRRVPTPRATLVLVSPDCAGAAPPTYYVSVNLDGANLTPKVEIGDTRGLKTRLVNGLQSIVSNGAPILIDFTAETHKYDVKWKLRVDYTANGQEKSVWIQNGSRPFHTAATQRYDAGLAFTLNDDQSTWTRHPLSVKSVGQR
jgi:hypothetical protein